MDREDIAELFSIFGPVSIRRVFSGFGVYADDVCFSLFLRGELYLKADETTAPRFKEEGSRPFSYTQPTSGKVVIVNSYWRLPERLYDDPDELAEWARVAVATAHRQKLGKRRRAEKRRSSKVPPVKAGAANKTLKQRTRPAAKRALRSARKRSKAKKRA